jgi:hypothetical protein
MVTRDIKEQFRVGGLDLDLGTTEPLFIHFDPSRPGAQAVLDPDRPVVTQAALDGLQMPPGA